jgi:hypothetical protein
MKKLSIKSIFKALLVNVLFGFILAPILSFAPVLVIAGLFLISCVPLPAGVAFMAIQKEIWEADIVENLFKDNEFLNYAVNADQYVLAGKVVHIPNAGGPPTVVKNRSSLPASVAKRTDVDITYALDEFTSDPIHIDNAESVELAYDKRQSVLADSQGAIKETVADWVLRAWAPSADANIIRTTGAAILAHLDDATGNRKKFLPADLKKARKVMNKMGVPKTERYALFSSDMEDQFTDGLTATEYRDFSRVMDEKSGIVGELYGFKIMSRDSVLTYTNASTPVVKDPGAAGAATDNDCVLCWQKQSVERALGEVKLFEAVGDPTYYGDIYSVLLRMGGRIRRNDAKGIVAIIQDSAT